MNGPNVAATRPSAGARPANAGVNGPRPGATPPPSSATSAPSVTVSPTDDPCADQRGDRDRGHVCEVRDSRLPMPVGALTVDAAPNGGIRVEAWDQADVLVRAVVTAYGDDDAEAKALLPQVRVTAAGATVSAEGPSRTEGRRRSGWSVSFRIWAPQTDRAGAHRTQRRHLAHRHARRVALLHHQRRRHARTRSAAGSSARTRNGGVNVRLGGTRWEGEGLDLETTNGGVSLTIPSGYSAELETGTVNGGFRSEVPLTVQGRIDREVRATLGSGGPRLKVTTTNGGVRITQR